MSSVVPDQMKTHKHSANNPEERNIPWSQQVDEAFYENLTPADEIFGKDTRKKDIKTVHPSTSKREDYQNRNNWSSSLAESVYDTAACNKSNKCNFISMSNEKKSFNHATTSFKKTTWASIASQPAKSESKNFATVSNPKKKGPGMPPPPMVPGKHNMDIVKWDFPNNNILQEQPLFEEEFSKEISENLPKVSVENRNFYMKLTKPQEVEASKPNCSHINTGVRKTWPTNDHSLQEQLYQEDQKHFLNIRHVANLSDGYCGNKEENPIKSSLNNTNVSYNSQVVLNELKDKNNYNPQQIDLNKAVLARFFVIKSYSEDDIHRSIKYEIWCSTDHGNKRLDDAFKERQNEGGKVLLFFSVNGSGHFCGVAQMMTCVDYNSTSSVWSQDKWKGKFKVKWIYVKDVPNGQLRHIKLENNDNKSVTNSRDTQEVPHAKGIQVLKIIHAYKNQTSIFDDFYHYEKKQEEEVFKKPHDTAVMHNEPINKHKNQIEEIDKIASKPRFFGSHYRDRNISQRGGYNNNHYNYRNFENHKTVTSGEYIQRDNYESEPSIPNRENRDNNNRHTQRCEYIRKEDKTYLKHNNRENYPKEEFRLGNGSKETDKVR